MRHSGEIQFAGLPVFSILSSVTGVFPLVDLRAQRASRHCLARQTLARLLASFASFDLVVAALVDPQLFMLAYYSWCSSHGQ